MGSTYYSNRESGTFAKSNKNDGAKTARDRREDNQFKKKDKDQEDESGDEFLDEMAGVGLGGKDDKGHNAKDKSQEKTKSPPKGAAKETEEKTPERKNQGEEIKKVGAKNDNKKEDDSEDDFLDEMAGVGLGGMDDPNKRKSRKERNTEAKAETNNIVGTIESRENN